MPAATYGAASHENIDLSSERQYPPWMKTSVPRGFFAGNRSMRWRASGPYGTSISHSSVRRTYAESLSHRAKNSGCRGTRARLLYSRSTNASVSSAMEGGIYITLGRAERRGDVGGDAG